MMIKIICSAQAYTYNAYHIVKAFYPAVEMQRRKHRLTKSYMKNCRKNQERRWRGGFLPEFVRQSLR